MFKKFFSMLMIVLISVGMLFGASKLEIHAASADISAKVTIDNMELSKKGANDVWEVIPDGSGFSVGEMVKLTINWQITAPNMAGVNDGDYFEIELDSRMNIADTSNTPLYGDNGTQIGTWRIVDNKIVTVLNDTGASSLFLKDGYFNVYFSIEQAYDNITLVVDGEDLGPFEVVPGGDGGDRTPIGGDLPAIDKYGGQEGYTKDTNWTINVNQGNVQKIYKNQSATIEQWDNTVLEDELPLGFSYAANSIEVTSFIAVPYGENDNVVTDMASGEPLYAANFTDKFAQLTNQDGESYTQFLQRVKENYPAIGLYDNKSMVVAFGNLPDTNSNTLNYFTSDAALSTMINNRGDDEGLSSTQKDILYNMYASNGPFKGQAISFRVTFKATADNPTSISETTNIAKVSYNNTESSSDSYTLKFQWQDGGVTPGEPGSVTLLKLDDNQTTKLEGVGFKLQKLNELTQVYSDYALADGSIEQFTDSNGIIKFTSLDIGRYKIVETAPLPGYEQGVTFAQGTDEFVISGQELGSIYFTAYNHAYTDFIDLSGIKTWVNDIASDRPEAITIQLLQNGIAYGEAITVTEQDNWQYRFTNLPEQDANGQPYIYSVSEAAVAGYVTTIDGVNLTNTRETPPVPPLPPTPEGTQPNNELPVTGQQHELFLAVGTVLIIITGAVLTIRRELK